MESQSRAKVNPNPRLETQQRKETPAPQPELPIKTLPGQNLPRQGRRDGGASPIQREGPSTENQRGVDTLFSTHHYISLVLETKEEEDGGRTIEGSGESAPSTRREDERERPFLQEEKSNQFLGEPINLLQSISVLFHLSQGQIEELTGLLSEMSSTPLTMELTCKLLDLEPQMKEIPCDSRNKNLINGLTEDPKDNPDGFNTTIELHNDRLKKHTSSTKQHRT